MLLMDHSWSASQGMIPNSLQIKSYNEFESENTKCTCIHVLFTLLLTIVVQAAGKKNNKDAPQVSLLKHVKTFLHMRMKV